MVNITTLYITACHYMPLNVTSCHCILHVTTCHYMSLHVTTCHYMSLQGLKEQIQKLSKDLMSKEEVSIHVSHMYIVYMYLQMYLYYHTCTCTFCTSTCIYVFTNVLVPFSDVFSWSRNSQTTGIPQVTCSLYLMYRIVYR